MGQMAYLSIAYMQMTREQAVAWARDPNQVLPPCPSAAFLLRLQPVLSPSLAAGSCHGRFSALIAEGQERGGEEGGEREPNGEEKVHHQQQQQQQQLSMLPLMPWLRAFF